MESYLKHALSSTEPCRTSILNALYQCIEFHRLPSIAACIEHDLKQDPEHDTDTSAGFHEVLTTNYNDLLLHARAHYLQVYPGHSFPIITKLLEHNRSLGSLHQLYLEMADFLTKTNPRSDVHHRIILRAVLSHPLMCNEEAFYGQNLHTLVSIQLIQFGCLYQDLKCLIMPFDVLLSTIYIQIYILLEHQSTLIKEQKENLTTLTRFKALVLHSWESSQLSVFIPCVDAFISKHDAELSTLTDKDLESKLKGLNKRCYKHVVKLMCDALKPMGLQADPSTSHPSSLSLKKTDASSIFSDSLTSANHYLYQMNFFKPPYKIRSLDYLEHTYGLKRLIKRTNQITNDLANPK